jgi:Glycine rich protein
VPSARQKSIRSRIALAVTCSSTLALAVGAAPAPAATNVFTYTGGEQPFEVPGTVHTLNFIVIGGHGGTATDGVGGAAAEVTGKLSVTPGQTLYIEVGGVGETLGEGGEGGFNGGGDGGGGGGGASDIRTAPRAAGLAPDTRLVVAGGGGGGGGTGISAGGNGGAAGQNGGASEFYEGGGAGTTESGGAGAAGCTGGNGGSGVLGEGGAGGNAEVSSPPGGGGGGGYYGGGGGGGSCEFGSSGGGGGSSLLPPVAIATLAEPSAAPKIIITYSLSPPVISITSPANGATFTQGQGVAAIYSCSPGEGAVQKCAGTVANGAALNTSTVGPHTFTVDAEDTLGGTSSQSVIYNVVAPAAQNPPSPSPPPVPNTTIGSHPKPRIKTKRSKVKVKFTFSSDVTGATFQCKLDKGSFAPCTSPKTYKVKPGKHKFSVAASGPGGTDATPASFSFKVKKVQ